MRTGLRSAARNGAKLSPLMQKIAGQTGPAGPSSRFGKAPNGQEWVMGGFQARMDKREASQILGLRLVEHDDERAILDSGRVLELTEVQ